MTAFDDIAQSFADLVFGGDVVVAGIVLGIVTVVAFLVAITWILKDEMDEKGWLVSAGIGIAFVVAVGWWPIWMLIFIALFLIFIIVNPFGD